MKCSAHNLIVFLSILLASCGSDKPKNWVEMRNADFTSREIIQKTSRVLLPIRIPLIEVEKTLNSKIPKILVNRKEANAGILITVKRAGNLSLSGREHTLLWAAPLKIIVGHKRLGGNITEFSLTPKFASAIDIKEDYSIYPHTELSEVVWNSNATVKLLGKNVDISNKVNRLLEKEAKRITEQIDAELAKLSLKKVLNKMWTKLCNPIRLNRRVQPVYLMVEARSLQLHRYSFSQNQLEINIGVTGDLQTVFDSAKHVRTNVSFPPFRLAEAADSASNVYLPIVLPFARINHLLEQNLVGQSFVVQNENVTIDSINITNLDSLLLISANIIGDINAKLQVLGRPKYDALAKTLTVDGFDYNMMDSDASFISMGDFLFHDEIMDEILSKLNVPLGSLIDTVPDLIYAGIEKGKSGKNLELRTEIDSITVDQLIIGHDAISLVLFARGNVDVMVERLKKKN